jgi:hypothetical protein
MIKECPTGRGLGDYRVSNSTTVRAIEVEEKEVDPITQIRAIMAKVPADQKDKVLDELETAGF